MDSDVILKICGLSDAGSARVAMDAGANALGFILAPSKRQVTPVQVAEIAATLPETRPSLVGVVVNGSPEDLALLLRDGIVDILQLSGDEEPDILEQLGGRVWKGLRFTDETPLETALRSVEVWLERDQPVERVQLDAVVQGAYGGTGHRANWELAYQISRRFPIVLAGGLRPENVAEAIQAVGPGGVDVSSGVESDGVKDADRIRAFIDNAAAAFADSVSRPRPA